MPKGKKPSLTPMGFPQTLPFADDPNDAKTEPVEHVSKSDYDKVTKQLEDLQKQIETMETSHMALMQNPAPQVRAEPPAFNATGLPDPIQDPEEYAKALAERTTAFSRQQQEYAAQQSQTAQQRNEQLTDLWEEFQERYPDYAEDFEKVEWAASKAAQKAQRRNLDVNKYMFGNRDKFMKDVVGEMDRVFGKSQPTDTAKDDDIDEAVGIFGGQESGGKPSGATNAANDDMFADLKAFQLENKFY